MNDTPTTLGDRTGRGKEAGGAAGIQNGPFIGCFSGRSPLALRQNVHEKEPENHRVRTSRIHPCPVPAPAGDRKARWGRFEQTLFFMPSSSAFGMVSFPHKSVHGNGTVTHCRSTPTVCHSSLNIPSLRDELSFEKVLNPSSLLTF